MNQYMYIKNIRREAERKKLNYFFKSLFPFSYASWSVGWLIKFLKKCWSVITLLYFALVSRCTRRNTRKIAPQLFSHARLSFVLVCTSYSVPIQNVRILLFFIVGGVGKMIIVIIIMVFMLLCKKMCVQPHTVASWVSIDFIICTQ